VVGHRRLETGIGRGKRVHLLASHAEKFLALMWEYSDPYSPQLSVASHAFLQPSSQKPTVLIGILFPSLKHK
jgi:hypothetical protein